MSKRNRLLKGIFHHGISKPIGNLVEILGGGRSGDLGTPQHPGLNPSREVDAFVIASWEQMQAHNAATLAKGTHRFGGRIDPDVDVY